MARAAPVVTSAGALVDALEGDTGAKRVVVVAPYMMPLTELVIDYIRARRLRRDRPSPARLRFPTISMSVVTIRRNLPEDRAG